MPIDPQSYGALVQQVSDLRTKVDKLEEGMMELLELANRGKGAFWAGMTLASCLGAAMSYFFSHLKFN